ncbi:NAD(P)/FAD-dependent oxidoreductase [Oceanibium sediminis]|uniref:NAD(P)/FAD-dependent oxidoreductase n=1 Tax=Oceanibium sediminis TaxID=2026339 RepID=UPI000DD3D198|nr:FAD-dependent oxidoreductase [Oceanibium sediminis]
MTSTDVLIVGGGIVGLVAAIELAGAGMKVKIIDAGINAGSTANAGSLHVQMQSRFMRLYPGQVPNIEASLPLYRAAVEAWVDLDAAHGPFDLVRKGGLMLAESPDQMAFLEQKVQRETARGVRAELLDRAAVDRFAPWLGQQIIGAELCLDEGKLNPLVANVRLRAAADRLGVRIERDWISAITVEGGIVEARGRNFTHHGDRVLIAAAWGAGPLARSHGLDIPTRAEPLHMNITEPCQTRIQHLIQHAERSLTLKQLGTGQIVIGGGWPAEDRGERTVPGVLYGSLLGNVALAAQLIPSIGGIRIIRTWAGMNTTADGASIIGPLPRAGRIVMAVPGDAGYTLGPLVARMAAAEMLGRDPPRDTAPFSPGRFAAQSP